MQSCSSTNSKGVAESELNGTELKAVLELRKAAIWSVLDTKVYADSDFKLLSHLEPNESAPRYYLKGFLAFTPQAVYETLFDAQYCEQWKPMDIEQSCACIKHSKTSNGISHDILRSVYQYPWPFMAREYIYQRLSGRLECNGHSAFGMVSRSMKDTRPSDMEDVKRVEKYCARLLLYPVGENGCDLFLEYQDDTASKIPEYVMKVVVSIMLPTFLKELRAACGDHAEYVQSRDEAPLATTPSKHARVSSAKEIKSHEQEKNTSVVKRSGNASTKYKLNKANVRSSFKRGQSFDIPTSLQANNSDLERNLWASGPRVTPDEVFTVIFHMKIIGLHLVYEPSLKQVVVTRCEANSEAATISSSLKPGCSLISINGLAVKSLPFEDVLIHIRDMSRPLTIMFKNPTFDEDKIAITPKILKHSKSKLKCLLTDKDVKKFIASLQPLNVDNYTGAILQRDIFLHARNRFGSSSKYTLVSSGFAIYKTDKCKFLSASYTSICDYLTDNPFVCKKITFLATDLVTQLHQNSRQSFFANLSGYRKSSSARNLAIPTSQSSSALQTTSMEGSLNQVIHNSSLSGRSTTAETESLQTATMDTECLMDYTDVQIGLSNLEWAWRHIQLLKVEERLLSITLLVDKINQFVSNVDDKAKASPSVQNILGAMKEDHDSLKLIQERSECAKEALIEFNSEKEGEWQFAQSYFGVSTFWKPGEDGTVWLKMDGMVEGADIFNTLAVIREIDLYKFWAPFCNASSILSETGRVELMAHFCLSLPLSPRDVVLHAYGVNACFEDRCILLLGKSAGPDVIDVPKLKGWNADRIIVHGLRALIEPVDKLKTRACIIINLDPKCPLPKNVINYWIRKGAGIMHYMIMKEAIKIEKARQEGTSNEHLKRIEKDPANFYSWLRPRIKEWFEAKGTNHLPTSTPNFVQNRGSIHKMRVDDLSSQALSQKSMSEIARQESNHESQCVGDSKKCLRVSPVQGGFSSLPSPKNDFIQLYSWCLFDGRIWSCILFFHLLTMPSTCSFCYTSIIKLCFTFCFAQIQIPASVFTTNITKQRNAHASKFAASTHFTRAAVGYDLLSTSIVWICMNIAKSHTEGEYDEYQHQHARRTLENFWLVACSVLCMILSVMGQYFVHRHEL